MIVQAEKAGGYESWDVPHIDSDGNFCSSAEKEAKDKKAKQLAKGESIEELEMEVENVPLISIEELEKITKDAYDEGFAKGVPDGRAEGFEEGKINGAKTGEKEAFKATTKKVEANIAKLSSAVNALQKPIGVQNSQIESSLLLIINRLTKAIVNRELAIDQSYIKNLIADAIDVLPVGSKNISITMNPEDLDFVRANDGIVKTDWNLVEDASVTRGGCTVETEYSFVDSTIEARMDKIIEQFMGLQIVSESESDDIDEEVNTLVEQQAQERVELQKAEDARIKAEETAAAEQAKQALLAEIEETAEKEDLLEGDIEELKQQRMSELEQQVDDSVQPDDSAGSDTEDPKE